MPWTSCTPSCRNGKPRAVPRMIGRAWTFDLGSERADQHRDWVTERLECLSGEAHVTERVSSTADLWLGWTQSPLRSLGQAKPRTFQQLCQPSPRLARRAGQVRR